MEFGFVCVWRCEFLVYLGNYVLGDKGQAYDVPLFIPFRVRKGGGME